MLYYLPASIALRVLVSSTIGTIMVAEMWFFTMTFPTPPPFEGGLIGTIICLSIVYVLVKGVIINTDEDWKETLVTLKSEKRKEHITTKFHWSYSLWAAILAFILMTQVYPLNCIHGEPLQYLCGFLAFAYFILTRMAEIEYRRRYRHEELRKLEVFEKEKAEYLALHKQEIEMWERD